MKRAFFARRICRLPLSSGEFRGKPGANVRAGSEPAFVRTLSRRIYRRNAFILGQYASARREVVVDDPKLRRRTRVSSWVVIGLIALTNLQAEARDTDCAAKTYKGEDHLMNQA